jgi:hypothetical protein
MANTNTVRDPASRPLPERADRMAKGGLPAVRKTDLRPVRAVNGAVLCEALKILRLTRLKDQTTFLGSHIHQPDLDPRQVARWFTGEDPIPWDAVLQIEPLQCALCQALLERQAERVEIRTVVSWRTAA